MVGVELSCWGEGRGEGWPNGWVRRVPGGGAGFEQRPHLSHHLSRLRCLLCRHPDSHSADCVLCSDHGGHLADALVPGDAERCNASCGQVAELHDLIAIERHRAKAAHSSLPIIIIIIIAIVVLLILILILLLILIITIILILILIITIILTSSASP